MSTRHPAKAAHSASGSSSGAANPDMATGGGTSEPIDEVFAERGAAAATAESDDLQKKIAEAEDRFLRAQADLDNFRKRIRREQEEERRYAALPVMQDLLPVLDNLERAVGAMDPSTAGELQQGLQMVIQQFLQVMGKYHCRPIAAEGLAFDPMMHEAIQQIPCDTHPPGTILQVQQTGYQLHDRVIRPAYVVVAGDPDSGGNRN